MLSLPKFIAAGLVGVAALVGCSAEETGAPEESVGTTDSALTVIQAQVLGNINPGEVKSDRYDAGGLPNRAYAFHAVGGDRIVADVAIDEGDAIGFLTDSNLGVITQNDDVADGSTNARVTMTVPPGGTRYYRIAFHDKTAPAARFRVKLGLQAGPCAPGSEPWHTYLGDAKDCKNLTWSCQAPEIRFENSCGCGCERPN